MEFRAPQSVTWVHLPNLISGYRVLPGDSRLQISIAFLVIVLKVSYLLAFVYLGPFPHPYLSSRGFSSAFSAFRILVKHDLLGSSHVLCCQNTACPSGDGPSKPAVEWSHLCLLTPWVCSSRMEEDLFVSIAPTPSPGFATE